MRPIQKPRAPHQNNSLIDPYIVAYRFNSLLWSVWPNVNFLHRLVLTLSWLSVLFRSVGSCCPRALPEPLWIGTAGEGFRSAFPFAPFSLNRKWYTRWWGEVSPLLAPRSQSGSCLLTVRMQESVCRGTQVWLVKKKFLSSLALQANVTPGCSSGILCSTQ